MRPYWPTTAEEVPDAIDQLRAQVKDLLGKDSYTYRAMGGEFPIYLITRDLYELASAEVRDMEEAAGKPSDTEEYAAAHAGERAAEARAINGGRL